MAVEKFDLQKAFTNFKSNCSNIFQNLPLFKPNKFSLRVNLEAALCDVGKRISELAFRRPESGVRGGGGGGTLWARVNQSKNELRFSEKRSGGGGGMSTEAIEERLAGVPLYALTNEAEEFVLVSGLRTKKSIGLFCFKKEDAEALLVQMRAMSPRMRPGSKVIPVALNKVFQLKIDGVAFRLVPESSQVKHALREKQKAGVAGEELCGVPVFQSRGA